MKFLSNALMATGALLLAHACYSAHEHSSQSPMGQPSTFSSSSSSDTITPHSPSGSASAGAIPLLPLDIILETLVSVLLLCLGLVLGSPTLQPTSWHVWAGNIEREGAKDDDRASGRASGNPFRALEDRVGFWDIRAKRREFVEWVREQDNVTSK